MSRALPCLLLHLFSGLVCAYDLGGEVLGVAGVPLEGALIEVPAIDLKVYTDEEGRFRLTSIDLPVKIKISRTGYLPADFTLLEAGQLRVQLLPQPHPLEEVIVTASIPKDNLAPASASLSEIDLNNELSPPQAVAGLMETVPGAALNGQGGLLQAYSIRGLSRHRVLTSLSGVRLTSERRAGVSASFIDPSLLSGITILKGPASSLFGSGALGGTADLQPDLFQGSRLHAGFASQGNHSLLSAGWGNSDWTAALAYRRSDNPGSPNGTAINSHFAQVSGVFSRTWDNRSSRYRLLIIPAFARDIGKAASDYPERVSNYPEENHLIVKFEVQTSGLLTSEVYIHPHSLQTEVFEDGSSSEVFNDTLDYGLRSRKHWQLASRLGFQAGIDYWGRRSVDAREIQGGTDGEMDSEHRTLANASEDEFGLQGAFNTQTSRLMVEFGGRLSVIRQQNGADRSEWESAPNGFVGAVASLFGPLEARVSLGTGLRFPSLSERFYSGTTGRGSIQGNRNLNSERGWNLEAGLDFKLPRLRLSGGLFRNSIDNYIERIELEPDSFTYVNLFDGTIAGVEGEAALQLGENWQIYLRGHRIRGESATGAPLADIPPDRLITGARYIRVRWRAGMEWSFLSTKSLPGSGEKWIAGAQPLRASIVFDLSPEWELAFLGTNLLNEGYYETPDRKAPLAVGRSIGVSLRWSSPQD